MSNPKKKRKIEWKPSDLVDLKGNKYLKASARLREFLKDYPHPIIEADPAILTNGVFNKEPRTYLTINVKVTPDAINEPHWYGTTTVSDMFDRIKTKKDGTKFFDPHLAAKLETQAVSRVLARFGYNLDGVVASSEDVDDAEGGEISQSAEQTESINKAREALNVESPF